MKSKIVFCVIDLIQSTVGKGCFLCVIDQYSWEIKILFLSNRSNRVKCKIILCVIDRIESRKSGNPSHFD